MNLEEPTISAVVCTRNRGDRIVSTIESILGNTHPNFELIIVDQSTDKVTETALKPFLANPRLRYIPTTTIGTGVARQIGLEEAVGNVVAYTDDDCTVPPNWLEVLSSIFQQQNKTSVVFNRVDPAPHDPAKGYIPAYQISEKRTLTTMRDCMRGLGLGAGMAVRRTALLSIGGFDRNLGPGSIFRAGEDHDIAIRSILNNWHVYEAPEVAVVHDGMRTWKEGKEHSKRDWFSGGATFIKPVKCGRFRGGLMLFSYPVLRGFWEPFSQLLHLKKPQGIGRFFHFSHGLLAGLMTSVDREKMLYLVNQKNS